MTEQDRPDDRPRRPSPRPRPTPGARPTPAARPSPRARVAGSRREREDDEQQPVAAPSTVATPTPTPVPARGRGRAAAPAVPADPPSGRPARDASSRRSGRPAAPAAAPAPRTRRGGRATALVLAVLCLVAAAGGGVLLWQRLHPAYVDPSVFSAARSGVEALYAYDYQDSEGSVQRKLDVLTGDLEEQYRQDLSDGGIVDTYEQVSATTSYDVAEVGLQQVNQSQDQATVVVFGQYVVKSVNSGTQEAPAGSECQVTQDGAQACTQTVQVTLVQVDGDWKISELSLLTTS